MNITNFDRSTRRRMPDNRDIIQSITKYLPIAIFLCLLIISACSKHDQSLRRAIESQMKLYPASTLQDFYKSFFQDEFGPGHMQPDSAGAAGYLDYELSGMKSRGDYAATPCGAGLNFCRVPLDLVKDSIVPTDAYLSAFLESAKGFKVPDLDAWKTKWSLILAEIESMNLQLPNFDADKEAIARMLASGEAVVHHSDAFIHHYDPHYRIMSLKEWEKLNSKFKTQNSKLLD